MGFIKMIHGFLLLRGRPITSKTSLPPHIYYLVQSGMEDIDSLIVFFVLLSKVEDSFQRQAIISKILGIINELTLAYRIIFSLIKGNGYFYFVRSS